MVSATFSVSLKFRIPQGCKYKSAEENSCSYARQPQKLGARCTAVMKQTSD